MARDKNPKNFFDSRIAQLSDNTPLFGKSKRKKIIEEICSAQFTGWHAEKVVAIIEGLYSQDKEVSNFAKNYLSSLKANNNNQQEEITFLCNYFIESQNPLILEIIQKGNFKCSFKSDDKTLEFNSAVYGIDSCLPIIENLSIKKAFNILQQTQNKDLKEKIQNYIHTKLTPAHIPDLLKLYNNDKHYVYCEYISKFFALLSFKQKLLYIESIPGIIDFEGNKDEYANSFIEKLKLEIEQSPNNADASFALSRAESNPALNWIVEALVAQREHFDTANELAMCNHFKEYHKVRTTLEKLTLEGLCDIYSYFANTPIECMFAQKLRMAIKKQNYKFNFNLLKDFFPVMEENLKFEVFKMLSNFSTPDYFDFVMYQMDKIADYSPAEQKIYVEEIIPFYLPMFARMTKDEQEQSIQNLPDFNYASLDFFINNILKMKSKNNQILFLESLMTSDKFNENQKIVIIDVVYNLNKDIFELSETLKQYLPEITERTLKLMGLLKQLENQCSRQYYSDDRKRQNALIDAERHKLIKQIQEIDIEQAIDILIPHYDEKNYRLKKDIKTILTSTQMGFRALLKYALTSGLENKDLRDFSVSLLDQKLKPYIAYKPTIYVKQENYKYIDLFLSEKDQVFRSLAMNLKRCNIIIDRNN